MTSNPRFLVGCDPELFLKNDKGQFISAHDILPGTKVAPYGVTKGAIQVDGVAAEFNIDPAEDSAHFCYNISQVMTQLKGYAKGAQFAIEPFAVFDQAYFDTLPDVVKELGCNPDYNAWTGQVNPAPDASGCMRTAAGHVHTGWGKDMNPHDPYHFDDCRSFTKQLDYYVGLYSLMWDPDNTRRALYGKAGAFRPKPYGCEYRVLSNVWLKSQKIQIWIFDAIQHAAHQLMSSAKSMEDQFGTYAKDVIDNNALDWWQTPDGKKIHSVMGMSFPDIRELQPKVKNSKDDELQKFYKKMIIQ